MMVGDYVTCVNMTRGKQQHMQCFFIPRRYNIMDNMLRMMEKYANNLEEVISERTRQLMEEKKKADLLLYRMLPACVHSLSALCHIHVGDMGAGGARGHVPPPYNSGKYFSGNYYVKFGHFVNFSCIFFGQKMSRPPKVD